MGDPADVAEANVSIRVINHLAFLVGAANTTKPRSAGPNRCDPLLRNERVC